MLLSLAFLSLFALCPNSGRAQFVPDNPTTYAHAQQTSAGQAIPGTYASVPQGQQYIPWVNPTRPAFHSHGYPVNQPLHFGGDWSGTPYDPMTPSSPWGPPRGVHYYAHPPAYPEEPTTLKYRPSYDVPLEHLPGTFDGFHQIQLNEKEKDQYNISDLTDRPNFGYLGLEIALVPHPGPVRLYHKPIHVLRETRPRGKVLLSFKSTRSFPNIFRRKWVIYKGYNKSGLKRSDIVAEVKRKYFRWFRPQLLVYTDHHKGRDHVLRYRVKTKNSLFNYRKTTSFSIIDEFKKKKSEDKIIGTIHKEKFTVGSLATRKQRYTVMWKDDSELDYCLAIVLGAIVDKIFKWCWMQSFFN